MTVGADDFRARFGEFSTVSRSEIAASLAAAAGDMNADVYGSRFDEAQSWLAAHKLAISPFGRSARLSADDGITTYWREFKRIQRECAPKFLVT